MKDGIHSLSWEQYAAADGISRSILEDIMVTPLHFHAKHIAKTVKEEETDAMRLGTLTHRCVLEPDSMDGAFHVRPAGLKFTTKEGIAWRDEHADKPILTAAEAAAISAMRDAVWNNLTARKLINGSRTEQCLFAEDSKGTLRKARLDLIPQAGNTLADLKTCQSASEHDMAGAMNKRGYNRQAAFSLALCRILSMPFENWILICVESSPPYDVVPWPVDEAAIAVGLREVEGAIQKYRNCLEANRWPGREDSLPPLNERSLTLPAWRQRELDAA